MKNNPFAKPLFQSAAIIATVVILILFFGPSDSNLAEEGGLIGFLGLLGNVVLFVLGLVLAIALCLVLLVGIFLAAVGFKNPEMAGEMYAGLRRQLVTKLLFFVGKVGGDDGVLSDLGKEDRENMQKELELLQEKNRQLEKEVNSMAAADVTMAKIPSIGIFSYIEKQQRGLFVKKVEEAVAQGMTNAEIDEYLQEKLPSALNAILKSHPILTKDYIRSERED